MRRLRLPPGRTRAAPLLLSSLAAACTAASPRPPGPAEGVGEAYAEDPALEPGGGAEILRARSDTVRRIAERALRDQGTWTKLQELCTRAPRRLSGSAAAEEAVRWARETMLADGLANVRLEPVIVPHWERGTVQRLVYVEPPELAGRELPILALGGSVATPAGGLEAEVVSVRGFPELEERAEEARGKLVLFARPMDPGQIEPFRAYGDAVNQRSRGAVEAARAGAVGALVRSMSPRLDDVPHTGGMRYADDVTRVPAAAVSTNGAVELEELLAQGRTVRLRLELDCGWREDALSHNVVGELTGTERPEEIVLIGGHLDSWDVGQGAHDDGAGCCQALEAVRLLQELGLRPRRTLRVVLFMNEENGLAGGRAYRDAHLAELEDHVLAIESDAGGFTPRGFTTNAEAAGMAVLEAMGEALAVLRAESIVPGGGGADISPLGPHGVVLAGFRPDAQRYFDLHHTELDTLDAVHPRELELGTAAIAALAWMVADADPRLPRNTSELPERP